MTTAVPIFNERNSGKNSARRYVAHPKQQSTTPAEKFETSTLCQEAVFVAAVSMDGSLYVVGNVSE